MRTRYAVALSALAALSAGPASALCNIGAVEQAGPRSVWIYFLTPAHVKITHAGLTRAVFIKPPPIRGNPQVKRPAILAELGDRLYSDETTCYMDIKIVGGRLGVDARRWGLDHEPRYRAWNGTRGDAFMPAVAPRR